MAGLVQIPEWRATIRDLLDELRDERIGRPARKIDDEDLVNGIEDLMDAAFERGQATRIRKLAAPDSLL